MLYASAVEEAKGLKEYLNKLKEANLDLQTDFSNDVYEGKYIKEDTNVGIFASKLQEITGQFMFRYLNKLIHILVTIPKKAGEKAYEYKKNENNK